MKMEGEYLYSFCLKTREVLLLNLRSRKKLRIIHDLKKKKWFRIKGQLY